MTSTAKKVLEEAMALSDEDRQHVAEFLLLTLSDSSRMEIERAWSEEGVRRAESIESGATRTLDGEDSVTALETMLRQTHRG